MNRKRRNNQQVLALEPKDRGEAPARGDGEIEPFMAKSATENSAFTEQLMEEVCDRENLERAWKRVKRNKGSPGVDGMTRRREGVPASALAKHSVSTAQRKLSAAAGQTGRNPETGRRGQETRRPLCRRPPDSTSRAASSPKAMGSDVFGAQFRISAGAVRPPGCSPGTALRRRLLPRSG